MHEAVLDDLNKLPQIVLIALGLLRVAMDCNIRSDIQLCESISWLFSHDSRNVSQFFYCNGITRIVGGLPGRRNLISSSLYPSAICSDWIGRIVHALQDWGRIIRLQYQILPTALLRIMIGFAKLCYSASSSLYPFDLFLLPQMWQGYRIALSLLYCRSVGVGFRDCIRIVPGFRIEL